MGKLTCECLNIHINTKTPLTPVKLSSLGMLGLDVNVRDEFFQLELSEVVVSIEGVISEHGFLIRTQKCGDWLAHQCINCGVWTHATYSRQATPEDGRVLVNSSLLADEMIIERLRFSSDFSPLYRIVLKTNVDSSPLAIEFVQKDVHESLQTVQSQLNAFLVTEESTMEERIRVHQETERENYARLQSKARADKNKMVATILSNVYKNLSESLSDAMKDSPIGSLDPASGGGLMGGVEHLTDVFNSSSIEDAEALEYQDLMSPLRRAYSRSESVGKRKSATYPDALDPTPELRQDFQVGHIVSDDVFQYDPGFQDDPNQNQPFSESDDDVNDTDEGSVPDEPVSRRSTSSNKATSFSTSVPIEVPNWTTSALTSSADLDDDDLDSIPRDEASMASIKALARSVHGNEEDIFGERPKRRTRAQVVVPRGVVSRP